MTKYDIKLNGKRYIVGVSDGVADILGIEQSITPEEPQFNDFNIDNIPDLFTKKYSIEKDVIAAMPGIVLSIDVKEGDHIKKGDRLITFESMKMENELLANSDGIVDHIFVQIGDKISQGKKLITII